MRGWGVSDLVSDLQLDPRMQDKIVLYDHASDSDLVHFYKHCLFTVYPSLYEGWGLPVAESLGFGKYCLASNAASIPEVAGDLLEYIDPLSVQEWADAIMELATDPKALHTRQKKIQQHFVIDRWERAGGPSLRCCAARDSLRRSALSLLLASKSVLRSFCRCYPSSFCLQLNFARVKDDTQTPLRY
jgi:glycosyltransferase involved in cell wall biosynthesis